MSYEKYQELKAETEKHSLFTATIHPPFNCVGDDIDIWKFEDGDGKRFVINKSAMNSLRQLTRYKYIDYEDKEKYNYRVTLAQLNKAYEDNNTHVIEVLTRTQEFAERGKNGLVAVCFDDQLVSVFVNYNLVEHEDLIRLVHAYGLASTVTGYTLESNFLRFRLFLDDSKVHDDFLCSLVVENCLDGWRGIGYWATFKFGEVEFKYQFKNAKRRHLSNLPLFMESLNKSLKKLSDMNLKEVFQQQSGKGWLLKMEKEFVNKKEAYQKFYMSLSKHVDDYFLNGYTCFDLMFAISSLGNVHGFKGVSNDVGEWLIKQLLFEGGVK